MTADQQAFAIDLCSKAIDHGQWLSIIKFGWATLRASPEFLMQLIAREAQRMSNDGTRDLCECAAEIVFELGLRFEVTAA